MDKKKLTLFIVGFLFWPITIFILIFKSKLSKKHKLIVTSIYTLLWIIIVATSEPSKTDTELINNTEPSTTTAVTTVTTKKTTKATTVTTEPPSDNPLLNHKCTPQDTGYGTSYAFITVNASIFDTINAQQLQEFVDKYCSEVDWLSIKLKDGTGLIFHTLKSTKSHCQYGELDEQGAITNGIGFVDFSSGQINICDKNENILLTTDVFGSENFEVMKSANTTE